VIDSQSPHFKWRQNTISTEKKDVFQRVTDQIVKAIEDGAGSYRMPWRTSGGFPSSPINAVTKRPYRGIDVIILWALAQQKEYKSGTWATYKQWQDLGGQVRKGEKSANVVFWKFFDREEESETVDENTSKRIPMARDYWVFNAEQVEGYRSAEEIPFSKEERIEQADEFLRAVGVPIKDGGNEAFLQALGRCGFHAAVLRVQRGAFLLFGSLARDHALDRASAPAKPRFVEPVWIGKLRHGGARCRTRSSISLRRAWASVGPQKRSRPLHQLVAEGAQKRQAGNLYRRSESPRSSRFDDKENDRGGAGMTSSATRRQLFFFLFIPHG
jgi:hypothetical protein